MPAQIFAPHLLCSSCVLFHAWVLLPLTMFTPSQDRKKQKAGKLRSSTSRETPTLKPTRDSVCHRHYDHFKQNISPINVSNYFNWRDAVSNLHRTSSAPGL